MTTASGQQAADNAGETDALDKAFEAALESADLSEATFSPSATDRALPKSEPVESGTEHAAEAASGDEEQKAEGEDRPEGSAPEPGLTAPAHWDAPRREAFGKLNPAGQKIVLDTVKALEGDFTRNRQELAEHANLGKAVRSLVTDEHRRQMAASGMDEAGGISYLLRLNDYARAQPGPYIRWFAQQTGVDLRQLFPELAGSGAVQPQGGAQRQPDPNQQLYSLLNPVISQVQGLVQERQQEREQTAEQAIAAFREAKAPDGSALHPHLPNVQQAMIRWLNQPELKSVRDFGTRLKRAYALAVNDDPQLRQQTFDAEVQRRLAEKQKAEDVAKARRARAPVRSSPSSPVTVKPKGLDEALSRAWAEVGRG